MIGSVFSGIRGGRSLVFLIVLISVLQASLAALSVLMLIPISAIMLEGSYTFNFNNWQFSFIDKNLPLLICCFGVFLLLKVIAAASVIIMSNALKTRLWSAWGLDLAKLELHSKTWSSSVEPGAFISLATRELREASSFVVSITNFCSQIITLCVLLVVMLLVDPVVTLVGISVCGLAFFGVLRPVNRFTFHLGRRGVKFAADCATLYSELKVGSNDIRLVRGHKGSERIVSNSLAKLTRNEFLGSSIHAVPTYFFEFTFGLGLVIVSLVFLLDLASANILAVSVPVLSFFVGSGFRFLLTASSASGNYIKAVKRFPSFLAITESVRREIDYDRLSSALSEQLDLSETLKTYSPLDVADFRVSDVTIKMGGKKLLDNVSFTLRAGTVNFLCGPSGSGKSSLVAVLSGLDVPDAGRVECVSSILGNQRVISSPFQTVGCVLQEPSWFSMTIRENLDLARSGASTNDMRYALSLAGILDEIDAMPLGLDAILESGGGNLSTGQKSRLGIARAVLRMPRLLVLDETTGSVPIEKEREIINRLLSLGWLTVLIVTHRRENEDLADQVLCLDNYGGISGNDDVGLECP